MPGKTAAKQDAARGVLTLLLDERSDPTGATAVAEARHLVGALFLAELDALESRAISQERAVADGHLGVDRLATGNFDQFTIWTARISASLEDQPVPVDRLSNFYNTVLVTRRRQAVRTWIWRNLPSRTEGSLDPTRRIENWWAGDGPARLALVADVLEAVEGGLSTEAILDCVERQANAVAASASRHLDSGRTQDESGRTLAVRVPGAEVSNAFVPVIEAIDAVVGVCRWARRPQALSVTVPDMPEALDSLSRAGLTAVASAFGDPWLDQCRTALSGFLVLTEGCLGSEGGLSGDTAKELSAAETELIEALRVRASRPDEDQRPRFAAGESEPHPEARNTR